MTKVVENGTWMWSLRMGWKPNLFPMTIGKSRGMVALCSTSWNGLHNALLGHTSDISEKGILDFRPRCLLHVTCPSGQVRQR
jgi:hypothetical protein